MLKINRSRFIEALTYGLLLSILISFGSVVQQTVSNLLFSDKTSIYDIFQPKGIAGPLSFWDWILSFYAPISALPSIACCYYGFKKQASREIFLRLSVAIYLAITALDTFFIIISKSSYFDIWQNAIYNLFGAPIFSGIIIALLSFQRSLSRRLKSSTSTYLSPIYTSLVAVSVFGFLYIFFRNFAWVTSTEIRTSVLPPISGSYSTSSKNNPQFEIFRGKYVRAPSFEWLGGSKNFRMGGVSELSSTIDIYFIGFCAGKDEKNIQTIIRKNPDVSLKFKKSFGISVSDGLTNLKVLNSSGSGYISSDPDDLNSFRIDQKKNTFDLTMFLDGNKPIEHKYWHDETIYKIDLFTLDQEQNIPVLHPRNFLVLADNNKINFQLNPISAEIPSVSCKRILAGGSGPNRNVIVSSGLISAVVRIRSNGKPKNPLQVSSITQIYGANGWLVAREIPSDELDNFISDGYVDTLLINGNFSETRINDKETATPKNTNLQASSAKLYLNSSDTGAISISGTSDAVFIGGERTSRTRWERLDPNIRLLLLGTLPIVSIWELLRRLLKSLTKDEEL